MDANRKSTARPRNRNRARSACCETATRQPRCTLTVSWRCGSRNISATTRTPSFRQIRPLMLSGSASAKVGRWLVDPFERRAETKTPTRMNADTNPRRDRPMIGTSRETVRRRFAGFKKQHLIEQEGATPVVANRGLSCNLGWLRRKALTHRKHNAGSVPTRCGRCRCQRQAWWQPALPSTSPGCDPRSPSSRGRSRRPGLYTEETVVPHGSPGGDASVR